MVFMHGLGDSALGWEQPMLELATQPELRHVEFTLPSAPSIPVTLNNGIYMPAWYDLKGLDSRDNEECKGIEESRATILAMVEAKIAKFGADRVVLGGFSQGGALAMYTGLQLPTTLAGMLVMSAYLPRPQHLRDPSKQVVAPEALQTPILQCHGTQDPVVQLDWALKAVDTCKKIGVASHRFDKYPIEHCISLEELQDVGVWLQQQVPATQ